MRSAESIIEVIMAIFVVATGSAAATSLVVSAMQSNGLSRDNLIALNLAVEGIEGMRNIRDSNWLKFGFNKELCWNMQPGKVECNDVDKIKDGNYTLFLDTATMSWNLSDLPTTDILNLEGNATTAAQFQLYFMDLDDIKDTDGNGTATDDPDLYVAAGTPGVGTASRFYRMITLEYPDGYSVGQSVNVSVLVQWKGATVHQVRLNTTLTNYNKVKKT